MGKPLSEMTLEELWALFPIVLVEHQDCWKDWYIEEETVLKDALPKSARIHHIGSTSVNSIWAKPIIDILVEVPEEAGFAEIKASLLEKGYICMSVSDRRLSFNKGYTEHGFAEKVYHLHLRFQGDNDELYFRDYLKGHRDTALEYERLKRSLWRRFEHDRDRYTNAKMEFVRKYTDAAKICYKGGY